MGELQCESNTEVDLVTGKYTEHNPIFQEFIAYLKTLGVPCAYVYYGGSNYLTVYVEEVVELPIAKRLLRQHSVSIIDKIFALFKKYDTYPQASWAQQKKRQPFYVTDVHCLGTACADHIIRISKGDLGFALTWVLRINPTDIFCHSSQDGSFGFTGFHSPSQYGGYRLVFRSPKESLSAQSQDAAIRALCAEVLSKNDPSGFCEKYPAVISYADHITDASSMYGMARED